MVSSVQSHSRRRGIVLAVAAFSAAVLLCVANHSLPSSLAASRAASSDAHAISLEQSAGVPVQLSLSVAPGQVLLPGQSVSARVGPYTFNGVVAAQQQPLAYSQPVQQQQYAFQPPQYVRRLHPCVFVTVCSGSSLHSTSSRRSSLTATSNSSTRLLRISIHFV